MRIGKLSGKSGNCLKLLNATCGWIRYGRGKKATLVKNSSVGIIVLIIILIIQRSQKKTRFQISEGNAPLPVIILTSKLGLHERV